MDKGDDGHPLRTVVDVIVVPSRGTNSPATVTERPTAVVATPMSGDNIIAARTIQMRQSLSESIPAACTAECTTLETIYNGCMSGDTATCLTICSVSLPIPARKEARQ